jgi:hypothetical protein
MISSKIEMGSCADASDGQTMLRLSRARHQTVKPFDQRQLHGTVIIRPELKIPHQQVTQK